MTTDSRYTWKFFLTSAEAWDAMYNDCETAKISIELEQYILENDILGQKFMELFIRKALSGVKVIVICDRFGSLRLYKSPLVRELREAGGYFYFYNPLSFWRILTPWRWFPRIHTKTLLIDSDVVYTGGVCIAERMRGWRDTQIRLTGPIISDVREAFDVIEKRYFFRNFFIYRQEKISGNFYYLQNWPLAAAYDIYNELVNRIRQAQKYIYITTLFFLPNKQFFDILKLASKCGVEVKIIVPERSDLLLADWVCISYIPKLLKSGIRIFHYQKSVIHCKTMVIDDKWATVGSTNMDVVSFFYNREANVITTNEVAISELREQFNNDLEDCVEVTWEHWKSIPLWKKTIGFMARIFKILFRA